MAARWYVLHSKPRKELVLFKSLQDKGFDVFYPCSSIEIDGSKGLKWIPYFPGYLFVKIDLDHDSVSTFQWLPYSTGLVCFGEKPGFVPENLIQAIRRRADNGHSSIETESSDVEPENTAMNWDDCDALFASIMSKRKLGNARVLALLQMLEGLNSLPD